MATTTTRPQIRHRPLDGLVRPSRWPQLIAETRCDGLGRPRADAGQHLHHTGLALDDVYSNNRSWSDLLQAGALQHTGKIVISITPDEQG